MNILLIVISAAVGYLLGSANSSLIVGRFYGVDIRKHGSGNAGATNTLRTLGKVPALLVLLGDALKGIAACSAGFLIAGSTGLMVGGIASVMGHNWPLYFGFKGGKGVLTSAAVLMMMDWKIGLILLGIFVIIVGITRYVSLGSVIGAAAFPLLSVFLNRGTEFVLFALLLGVLIILRHHANIKRLIKGSESKIGKNEKH